VALWVTLRIDPWSMTKGLTSKTEPQLSKISQTGSMIKGGSRKVQSSLTPLSSPLRLVGAWLRLPPLPAWAGSLPGLELSRQTQ
jgi:hypothetical protein